MELRGNDATSRGVPHIPGGKEESVSDIAQKVSTRLTTQCKKQTLFLLLFHYHIKQLIMKRRKNLILGFGDLVEWKRLFLHKIMQLSLSCAVHGTNFSPHNIICTHIVYMEWGPSHKKWQGCFTLLIMMKQWPVVSNW